MGQTESSDLRLMYEKVTDFAIRIRTPDKMNIVNAGRDVVKLFYGILDSESLVHYYRFKHVSSTFKFYIKGQPFSHKGRSTFDFKLTFLKILNQLFEDLQMVPFISSDLSLIHDTSTVFFKKIKKTPNLGKYACIAPSGIDSLYLLHVPYRAVILIFAAIDSGWGVDSQVEMQDCYKVKMKGSPWGPGGKGENATSLRRLLLQIFNIMRSFQYRFVSNISMKGATDDIYFQFDSSMDDDSSPAFVLYLSKSNRLRFIDGPASLVAHIKNHINHIWDGGVTAERVHNDAMELKVHGSPWKAHSTAGANSRVLISTILKEIRHLGYQTIATLDISRRSDDKSIFIFEGKSDDRIDSSIYIKWTCLYFCSRNKLVLVGIQSDVLNILQDCLKPLKKDNGTKNGDLHIWKLESNIFSYGDNSSKERFCIVLLSIYKRMEANGWHLTSSADVSSKTKSDDGDRIQSYDAHSWYFLKIVEDTSKT